MAFFRCANFLDLWGKSWESTTPRPILGKDVLLFPKIFLYLVPIPKQNMQIYLIFFSKINYKRISRNGTSIVFNLKMIQRTQNSTGNEEAHDSAHS